MKISFAVWSILTLLWITWIAYPAVAGPAGRLVESDNVNMPFVACGALVFTVQDAEKGKTFYTHQAGNLKDVPGEIRKAFKAHGTPLNSNATIEQQKNPAEWRVIDPIHGGFFVTVIAPLNRIDLQSEDHTRMNGSGAVVGPRHILTVHHNFFSITKPQTCQYWPALDINGLDNLDSYTSPFQPLDVDLGPFYGIATSFKYPGNDEWNSVLDDAALIELPGDIPRPLIDRIDSGFRIANPTNTKLSIGMKVHVAGYPGTQKGRMWTTTGEIIRVERGLFYFLNKGLAAGASGSPVWIEDDRGNPLIVGMYSKGIESSSEYFKDDLSKKLLKQYGGFGVARHIDEEVFTQIPAGVWKQE